MICSTGKRNMVWFIGSVCPSTANANLCQTLRKTWTTLNITKTNWCVNYLNGQSFFTFLIRRRQGRGAIGVGIGVGDHLSFVCLLLPLLLLFLPIPTFILVRNGKARDVETSKISFFLYNPGCSDGGGCVSSLHESWQSGLFLFYHHSAHIQLWNPLLMVEVRKTSSLNIKSCFSQSCFGSTLKHKKIDFQKLLLQLQRSVIEQRSSSSPVGGQLRTGASLVEWRPGAVDAKSSPSRPAHPPPLPAKSHKFHLSHPIEMHQRMGTKKSKVVLSCYFSPFYQLNIPLLFEMA